MFNRQLGWLFCLCAVGLPSPANLRAFGAKGDGTLQPGVPSPFAPNALRGADQPSPGDVTLSLADGSSVTGPLEELGESWSVRLGGTPARQVAGSAILTLQRLQQPSPPFPAGEQVILANGDRLPAQVLRLTGERLRIQADLGQELELALPLSAVSVIWLAPPDGTDYPDQLRHRLAAERRRRDFVLLRNGDVAEGLLTGLERNGRVRVERNKKEVRIDFRKVAALALGTEQVKPPRKTEAGTRLVLVNGARLTLAAPRPNGGRLTGTMAGAEVSLPLERVQRLDLSRGRVVYLSDLKPRKYEPTAFLGTVGWPLVRDGSVVDGTDTGGDLRLGGRTYEKGLGMHSPCRVTFDLGGDYRRFEALVGLDDVTGRSGQVRVGVLVDGQARELGWDGELAWETGPSSVRVNVERARELTLVVECGRYADVRGHVNWVDARLVK